MAYKIERYWDFNTFHSGTNGTYHPTTTSTSPVDTRARKVGFDKSDFDGDTVEIFFEVLGRINNASSTASFELYDETNGNVITTLTVTGSTAIQRVRSSDLLSSIASGLNNYKVRFYVDADTASFYQARLIIRQTGTNPNSITKTAGRILMLNYNSTPSSSYTNQAQHEFEPKFLYKADKWADTNFYLECGGIGGGTLNVDLYDETAAAQVSGSEITITTENRVRTSALTLIDGHVYRVRSKFTSSTSTVISAALVTISSNAGGVGTFVDYRMTFGDLGTSSSGSGTEIENMTQFDPSVFEGNSFVWFYTLMGRNSEGSGSASMALRNDTAGSQISTLTWGATTAWSMQRNDGISMPGSTSTIDSWVSTTGSGAIEQIGGWYGVEVALFTVTKTHTTNALLKKAFIKTHTSDAHLKRGQIKTHTADSYVRKQPGVPIWVSPANHATGIQGNTPLIFASPSDVDFPQHFQMQVDTVNTFDGIDLLDKKSWLDQTGWEYWDGDSWEPLPQTGLPVGMAGNDVRFTPSPGLGNNTWYRRVRARIMNSNVIGSKQ